ncbi:hypothetical protein [Edaphobacter aggregans]|uniref:hypothetical protein n=1 Tax=Edaphobacter aggregans TaxID=570835 RepID=UPI000558CA15|nr:hypothetical protein [Edaphobacter aggregans]
MAQRAESQTSAGVSPVAAARAPVWPMIPGIIVAAWVLDFVCSWLRRGTLPRFGAVLLAASLLLVAVMVCGFVVRTICASAVPGGRRLATPVVRAACLAALWIPAWVLFVETWSLLMLLAGCVCLAILGIFLKRCDVEAAAEVPGELQSPVHGVGFQFEAGAFRRMILPSFLLAVLVEAAVALMAARRFTLASVAVGVCAAVLGWRATQKTRVDAGMGPMISRPRQVWLTAAAFVFTVIALLPYLRVAPFRLLHGTPRPRVAEAASSAQPQNSEGYVGIILLPLSDEHKKISLPVKRELVPTFGVKIAEPMEIPFDGQYWFFKAPDKQPRPTAKVVKGSTLKTTIRSSDRYPLLMEAHQKLDTPMDLGCCSAMDLVVQNGDRREGTIALELWVRKKADDRSEKARVNAVAAAQAPHYLGTAVIPSSEQRVSLRGPATGSPPEERLRFPVPAAMDGVMFDEITVVVHSAPARATTGAQIAIRKFVLEP